jgi:hypothetical protein
MQVVKTEGIKELGGPLVVGVKDLGGPLIVGKNDDGE